ncbi:MAG: TrmH family RNA methyltransferase [Anaerolineaceae bacterium]|jgi:tRNA G18 (ribose-2'-O)-methylase SpoU|nr:TrmH family RNA methyltransferase [Anaerolineaceae bacterium]
MPNQHQYQICQCQNQACRLRFPVPSGSPAITSCPFCSSPLTNLAEVFSNRKPESTDHTGSSLSISVALDNLRSAYNVGAIFRTADAVGIQHIHLYGITPTPDNPKVQKTSLSAEFAVPWTHHKNSLDHLATIKHEYQVWAIEGGQHALSIFDLPAPKTNHPILLVFGSEYAGIDPAILRLANQTIFIPMIGFKRSLNVASAFAIATYTLRFNLN